MGKLDQLFDQAEGKSTLDDLFDQVEATPAVPDFLKPTPIPGVPGMGGENIRPMGQPMKPADVPAPPPPENPTVGQMFLPNTLNPKAVEQQLVYAPDSSGQVTGYVPTSKASPFSPLGDLFGLPTRAAGAALDPILPWDARGQNADGSQKSFGQAMANPDAGLGKAGRDKIAESIKTAWQYAKDDQKPFLMRSLAGIMGGAAAAAYLGVSAAEDPTILIPGVAGEKAAAMGERLAARVGPGMRRVGNAIAEAPNKLAGKAAEEMSGVSEEALRAAGTAQGRATLQGAYGKQKEIGDDLLHRLDNMDQSIPERQQVDDALSNMGNMSLDDAIQSLESAKVQPVPRANGGPGILLPNEEAANKKIDTYIQAMRGGEVPTDLGAAARGAQTDLSRASDKADNLTDLSKLAGKDAAQAAQAQSAARSQMGKSANEIKNLKTHGTDFGWWYDQAKQDAKDAAQAARDAAQNVEASGAVKGIRSQDADAAQAAVMAAERNYAVADGAAQLYAGQPIKTVAQDLIKTHGLKGDDLRTVLTKARDRAAKQPEPLDLNVSATNYRQLRKKLDVNIDFDTEEGKLVNNALKQGRGTMKDALIAKAKESGNPDYEKWMQSWSDKLNKLDAIKGMLGANADTRAKRVEKFVSTMFGKNTEYKQQLIRDLDGIFGSQILGNAKSAALASELGKGGKAALFPRQLTGRALLGHVMAPGVSIPFSSPYLASRFTLPVAQGLEDVLKFTGGKLSSRSQAALRAMMKTRNQAVQLRLLSLIQKEVPSNAVPFKRVAANQPDQTRTNNRYAGR